MTHDVHVRVGPVSPEGRVVCADAGMGAHPHLASVPGGLTLHWSMGRSLWNCHSNDWHQEFCTLEGLRDQANGPLVGGVPMWGSGDGAQCIMSVCYLVHCQFGGFRGFEEG